MKKRIVPLLLVIAVMLPLLLTGCFQTVTIPSGYIGRVLTPSGWDKAILSPGQVNIGAGSFKGQQSKLVLVEATTITVLETFRDAVSSNDKQDHRIITKDGVPVAVDMYVRLGLPDDRDARDRIFLEVTPVVSPSNDNISIITLQNIYARFVEMDVRNRVRDIISGYQKFQDVLTGYGEANKRVTAASISAFKESGVPLILQDAQLSQVMPDPQVWDSEVKKKASVAFKDQIDTIGEAVAKNPGYLEYLKWEALRAIAATAAEKGNNLIIVTDSQGNPGFVVNPYKPPTATTPSTPQPTQTPVPSNK